MFVYWRVIELGTASFIFCVCFFSFFGNVQSSDGISPQPPPVQVENHILLGEALIALQIIPGYLGWNKFPRGSKQTQLTNYNSQLHHYHGHQAPFVNGDFFCSEKPFGHAGGSVVGHHFALRLRVAWLVYGWVGMVRLGGTDRKKAPPGLVGSEFTVSMPLGIYSLRLLESITIQPSSTWENMWGVK